MLCYFRLAVPTCPVQCIFCLSSLLGGSVVEWLACWTQAQNGRVQIAVATLSGNSLRQSAHIYCASIHEAAKLAAALLRVAGGNYMPDGK